MHAQCARKLGFSDDASEEDLSNSIVGLVLSALNDDRPRFSFLELSKSLDYEGSGSIIDCMTILPPLLRSSNAQVDDLVPVLGKHASAKEIVIAVQEALAMVMDNQDDLEDDDGRAHSATQLLRALRIYAASIPRLALRKKTPVDTLSPLFDQLLICTTFVASEADADSTTMTEILRQTCVLLNQMILWLDETLQLKSEGEDAQETKKLGVRLLDGVLTTCYDSLPLDIAQSTFQDVLPRFVLPPHASGTSAVVGGSPSQERDCMQEVLATYQTLGISPTTTHDRLKTSSGTDPERTTASLITLAHTSPPLSSSEARKLLEQNLPVMLASLRSTTALNASLSLLLRAYIPAPRSTSSTTISSTTTLDPTQTYPLIHTLSALSSSHPSSNTRHIAFRLLASLLSSSPEPVRLDVLKELTGGGLVGGEGDDGTPQMRIAAVGLVKDAILEGLSRVSASDTRGGEAKGSLFASPAVLQALAPHLLTPHPADLFHQILSPSTGELDAAKLKDFVESPELARLGQVLALYYVVFMRDTRNCTGIRDKDNVASMQKTLFHPLSEIVRCASTQSEDGADHSEAGMRLASLAVGLERIQSAWAQLA